MAIESNSNLVLMKISTVSVADIAANGKSIVCEESSNANASANTNERKTKCGVFTSTDAPVVKIAGAGVAGADLVGASEVSAQDIIKYIDARTLIYFIYANSVSGTIAVGEVVYIAGTGRFSNVSITSDEGDGMTTFDWEFAVTGTVDYIP